MCHGFGQPSKQHSFTQTAAFETVTFHILKNSYLDQKAEATLRASHPLINHMAQMIDYYAHYDFTWLKKPNPHWASQSSISAEKVKACMACLFHYDLNASMVMRYLGGNYTGEHRDIAAIIQRIKPHVSPYLLNHFERVMTLGCPNVMVYETTRENTMQFWRKGNHPSIAKKLQQVLTTMNKEERNNFVIPLASWLARFVPHSFFTPQLLLEVPGKKDRQIFNGGECHTMDSIPVNQMTSCAKTTELPCQFGTVQLSLLKCIYNLRISNPKQDIIIHANDVKSCFRQLKHHPEVMGAFSYIIGHLLFLQCGLTFGSDFSPASWEVLRRLIEELAQSLFKDTSLQEKHKKHLEKLNWSPDLGSKNAKFTPAKADAKNQGIQHTDADPNCTPHYLLQQDVQD